MFHSIRWRIAVPYALLILVVTLGLTFYVSNQMRRARLADLETQLLSDARLLADNIESNQPSHEDTETWDRLARHWAALLAVRITIIDENGTVLGESQGARQLMANQLHRPEVQQALASGQGNSIRFSKTTGYEMMYAAVRVNKGRAVKVVSVALPLRHMKADVGHLRRNIMLAGLLAALLGVIIALLIAERTARPVRRLTDVANRLAQGELSASLLPSSRDEIGQLTDAFNEMAAQLREKMTILTGEQERLAAVLAHMADGVLITDERGQVALINQEAAKLLDTDETEALGRTFAQVVHHHQLIKLWQQCRELGQEQYQVVEVSRQDLFLQAIMTPFQEAKAQGCLIILQDLTRIRRLETIRRDFISNISHELRTPLAGLKALVDTLRAGALDDPPAAQRFLNRMDTEVDTLTQMVQELLELSRIESGQVPLRLTATPVADLILEPADRLLPQAERAGLALNVDLPPELPVVWADSERIRQVITNLVHNAIKFTPEGGHVTIAAEQAGDEVVIAVRDTGIGIPAEALSRIFERFYKAHRERSGGSGLGLAIAKHIVQGHGGRIWAESVEGQGSTFYFLLAVAPAEPEQRRTARND